MRLGGFIATNMMALIFIAGKSVDAVRTNNLKKMAEVELPDADIMPHRGLKSSDATSLDDIEELLLRGECQFFPNGSGYGRICLNQGGLIVQITTAQAVGDPLISYCCKEELIKADAIIASTSDSSSPDSGDVVGDGCFLNPYLPAPAACLSFLNGQPIPYPNWAISIGDESFLLCCPRYFQSSSSSSSSKSSSWDLI